MSVLVVVAVTLDKLYIHESSNGGVGQEALIPSCPLLIPEFVIMARESSLIGLGIANP